MSHPTPSEHPVWTTVWPVDARRWIQCPCVRLTTYIRVENRPDISKVLEVVFLQHHGILLVHVIKAFQDNGNKQVKKDQRYEQHERVEIEISYFAATPTYRKIALDVCLISLVRVTLEIYAVSSDSIVHYVVPCFPSWYSEESQEGSSKRLEVGMSI